MERRLFVWREQEEENNIRTERTGWSEANLYGESSKKGRKPI